MVHGITPTKPCAHKVERSMYRPYYHHSPFKPASFNPTDFLSTLNGHWSFNHTQVSALERPRVNEKNSYLHPLKKNIWRAFRSKWKNWAAILQEGEDR